MQELPSKCSLMIIPWMETIHMVIPIGFSENLFLKEFQDAVRDHKLGKFLCRCSEKQWHYIVKRPTMIG
jgi:hypothetical protein